MSNQHSAILRLLGDDDASTVALVEQTLTDTESLNGLRALRAEATGRAAGRLDALIRERATREAESAFLRSCASFGEYGDIEAASWQLAAAFDPIGDFSVQRETLDAWGAEVAARLTGTLSRTDRIRVLADFLGMEMRLRGNDDDYYNIENSLLPRVIDTRLGIPISLSLVYILVGRRAGLPIEGVGLPGHFLARHEDVFFDPFHAGARVGLEECAKLMEQQNLVLTPQHLIPTTPRQILARLVTNIHLIAEQHDPPLAARTARWLDALRRGVAKRE
ncbi:MAG TPA: transglutaminase-like domain-containing protein [Chthoniobacteraceae bacterium]|jgi:regulator of sirC expression with transglutaminase-like and TPR domain